MSYIHIQGSSPWLESASRWCMTIVRIGIELERLENGFWKLLVLWDYILTKVQVLSKLKLPMRNRVSRWSPLVHNQKKGKSCGLFLRAASWSVWESVKDRIPKCWLIAHQCAGQPNDFRDSFLKHVLTQLIDELPRLSIRALKFVQFIHTI